MLGMQVPNAVGVVLPAAARSTGLANGLNSGFRQPIVLIPHVESLEVASPKGEKVLCNVFGDEMHEVVSE